MHKRIITLETIHPDRLAINEYDSMKTLLFGQVVPLAVHAITELQTRFFIDEETVSMAYLTVRAGGYCTLRGVQR